MFEPDWSRDLLAGARGLSLARERGWLLAWDEAGWLTLLDHVGRRQAQRQFAGLVGATTADDGSAYAAIGKNGEIWWLAPDFNPRWEKQISQQPLTLALDPFGQYLAVTDSHGQVRIFDRAGKLTSEIKLPRP